MSKPISRCHKSLEVPGATALQLTTWHWATKPQPWQATPLPADCLLVSKVCHESRVCRPQRCQCGIARCELHSKLSTNLIDAPRSQAGCSASGRRFSADGRKVGCSASAARSRQMSNNACGVPSALARCTMASKPPRSASTPAHDLTVSAIADGSRSKAPTCGKGVRECVFHQRHIVRV